MGRQKKYSGCGGREENRNTVVVEEGKTVEMQWWWRWEDSIEILSCPKFCVSIVFFSEHYERCANAVNSLS